MKDLDPLRVFAEVVERGSFVAAGRTLGVPASTVSRTIDRIEKRLGAALLYRSTRSVQLTEIGQAYYEGIRTLLADERALEERIRGMSERLQGCLRISIPSVQDTAPLLERLIEEFAKQTPDLQVDTVATNRRVDLLSEAFDVALRAGPVGDDRLQARKLFSVEWRLLATPQYLEGKTPIGVEPALRPHKTAASTSTARSARKKIETALAGHRCLAFTSEDGSVRWPLSVGGDVLVTPALRSNNLGIIRRALLGGQGIALVPVALFERERKAGDLVCVAEHLVLRCDYFYVVYPALRPLPAKTRAFVDFAVAFFKKTSLRLR